MTLEMYIDGKLADSTFLSIYKIASAEEREVYIQGAMNVLLEKWSDLVEDQDLKPEFFIKGQIKFE